MQIDPKERTHTHAHARARKEWNWVLTQGLMKLARHRGHGSGWEAVDVERPHLVDLRGGESHTRREVTSVACSHDSCLLLHELKKRDTEEWVEERRVGWDVWESGAVGKTGCNGRVIENIESWEGVRQRREKGGKGGETNSKGRTEGGMYVEVDGWIVHGKHRESRAEWKKEKKKEACQPMFCESVYPPSRKPVTSCRNDLKAVCWAHTNQDIDMCTLSPCSGNRQSLQKSCNVFFPDDCQTSPHSVRLYRIATDMLMNS